MATYKVIQDIEAEDKLLGPLTLRQFIYAAVVAVMGFIAFKLTAASPFLVIPFLPPMVFFGMLAAPFGHDQPSEVWMLAKFRFFLKPRRRIWNQDGVQELVKITVPKKLEKRLTNGLNQYEVKSRLQALASTLDSRGWAIKNVSVNMFSQPSYLTSTVEDSDRLVEASNLPQEVPNYEVYAADDILDERSNPTAQHLNTMINQSEQTHRQAVVASLQNNPAAAQPAAPPADYWFMNQPSEPPAAQPPGYATFSSSPVVFPGMDDSPAVATLPSVPSDAEEQLLNKIHTEQSQPDPTISHLKTLQPLSSEFAHPQPPVAAATTPTPPQAFGDMPIASPQATPIPPQPPTDDASATPTTILRLADNNDLDVATLAREAKKSNPADSPPEPLGGEVTISLR